jgi:prepilin-type N-terminal cleavage/methylation domain-containing protein
MRCNRRPDSVSRRAHAWPWHRTAFTLVELLVCLAVVALLTGIMLPALRHVREASLRIRCASNMHQIGIALSTYAHLNGDRLPSSWFADPDHRQPQELMAASLGANDAEGALASGAGWEGLGRLVRGEYLGRCECLYCPSHHGEHTFERYERALKFPTDQRVYTNYHYAGHVSPTGRFHRLSDGADLLLLTDGLRTRSDFNHRIGCNRLFADISTDWWYDAGNTVRDSLPMDSLPPSAQADWFDEAWSELAKPAK